jgi:hypothetical protein
MPPGGRYKQGRNKRRSWRNEASRSALGLHFAAAGAALAADDDLLEACKEFSTNGKICDCIEEKVTDDDERQEMIGCYRAAAAGKKGWPALTGQCNEGFK